jgi:hypothetical protein
MSKKINRQFACSRMMLPEHSGTLEEHNSSAAWDETHRRPHLDEQRQEEMQQILARAILNRLKIKLIILNGSGYHTYCGVPLPGDSTAGKFFIDTGAARPLAVRAAEVVCLEPA